jgi:PAS domain S-box-containing protein
MHTRPRRPAPGITNPDGERPGASDEFLLALLETMTEGVVLQDADGTITECSEAAERILGLTRDQMAGLSSIDPRWAAIHEDGSPFPGETHPAMVALQTGEPVVDVVMGVRLPDGTVRWISIAARPIRRPGAEAPHAVVCTFFEVTDLRRKQAALEESEKRYRRLADHSADVIWTMDPTTLRYTYISPSIKRLRGLTVEEALAESLAASLMPESAELVAYRGQRLGRSGGLGPPEGADSITDIYDQPCRDGSIKHVEITTTAVVEDGRLISILGVSRDVTERVESERARQRMLEDLRDALARVRTLSGLLPICMYCKKIRTDGGYWDRIEAYISEHTDAVFSHGLCPDCFEQRVPADLRAEA